MTYNGKTLQLVEILQLLAAKVITIDEVRKELKFSE